MKKKCKTFEELTSLATDFLRDKLLRSEGTVYHYRVLWRRLRRYMESKQVEHFDATIGKEYLLHEFGDRDYSRLNKREKDLIRSVHVLCEIYETGLIQSAKEQTTFDGSIGQLMMEYLAHKTSLRLKKHTIDEHTLYLSRFLCYLQKNGITTVKAINQLHILNYHKEMNSHFSTQAHYTIITLRGFFKYLYDQHLLGVDFSYAIPKDNYKKQAKLPSVYSTKEIETMIRSINRTNATGKRNYVIVLLAARLGLRASDIANLKFENLHWEECTIVLNQYKTGKKIELPILTEIGDAIIDYLRYGRPKSKEAFVFLLSRSPYTPVQSGAITGIVHSCLVQAGINIENRKHGSHALRHSLAGILLEKGTILPVISEVLGHENTASTKYYLRIDLKSLRRCALEVPSVSSSFYDQKGGYFYE
ncbi:MAG TPA: site-specific integrase [Candidatus Limnocylindrales bacterium]|nr:site-specific integrase [Candidatus Limnocylindrales bacterium]